MKRTITHLLALLALTLFATVAVAQTRTTAETTETLREADGSGEGEEVQGRAVGPIRTATSANEVRQGSGGVGGGSVGEGTDGGDEDDSGALNGSGGN